MGRISDLIERVASENSNLSTTLRQTKILAYELGVREIAKWVDQELNGYGIDDSVPSYRSYPCSSLGTYIDPGKKITRYPVPINILPDEVVETFANANIHLGIGSIESLLEDEFGAFRANYTSEHLGTINYFFQKTHGHPDVGFIDAWKEISESSLKSIVENVRNRLLGFLLNLRDEYPELDVEHPKPTQKQQEDAK